MSAELPRDLYDAASTRELDRVAIEQFGIPGLTLMQCAGQAAYEALRERWPEVQRVSVLCGTGNNGGDGFVIAGLAAADDLDVEVIILGDRNRISGDAAACFKALADSAVSVFDWERDFNNADVVVDALFGTGLDRDLAGDFFQAVERMNAGGQAILSVDIPSGINATSGRRMGTAVAADLTVTFIGVNQGLLTGDAPAFAGDIVYRDLEVPAAAYRSVPATAQRMDYANVRRHFRARPRAAHKGHYGHVLVIGGAPGFGGAAAMAAEAAARCGAGLVSAAVHPINAGGASAAGRVIMCHAVADATDLRALLDRTDVIAIGPGLGQSAWSQALLASARECRSPVVMDADALNLLATDPDECESRVITPHPGEAARLLGTDTAGIQHSRFEAARELNARFGGVVVLKGAGTIVQAARSVPRVVSGGNPGMASGGMGDVLTGIIAGLIAQGFPLSEAATVGAVVHAHAADRAAEQGGERGMLATDLMPFIRAAVNP